MNRSVTTRALLIGVGVGVGPLVQLLATPLLARLYLPADFGRLAVFLSAAGILVAISCLRYEVTIAVVDDEHVPAGVWVAVSSALLLFLILLLVVSLHLPQVLIPQLNVLGEDVWSVPIFSVCGGFVIVGMQLTLRRAEFGLNAALRSAQTVLFVLLALTCTPLGLVKVSALSAIAVAIVVLFYLVKVVSKTGGREICRAAYKYKQYPLILMPTSLVDAMATSSSVFIISWAYGVEATGQYAQIQKLVGAPLVLAAVVAGQLFLKNSAEKYRRHESSKDLLWTYVMRLGLLAVVVVMLVGAGGEYILGFVLGPAWRVDTWFLMLVIMPQLFKLIVSPISSVFITHNRVGPVGVWQVTYFASTLVVLYLAAENLSFEHFLCVYAIHEAVLYSVYLYMANLAAQRKRTAQ